MKKQELGKMGEELACAALKKKGYRIIEKNYRCRHGEIDIVARQKDSLVFIEVRSKMSKSFGLPEESITLQKRQKLISTALEYLNDHRSLPENWRIDFVAIEFDPVQGKACRIEIVENVVN
jgi:putative endonuclease